MSSNDFIPPAQKCLTQIEEIIDQVRLKTVNPEIAIDNMTQRIKQLKQLAASSGYGLISHICNIILTFLEGVKETDPDFLAFVETSHKALQTIVAQNITGSGGAAGVEMEKELKAAAQRYFKKHTDD